MSTTSFSRTAGRRAHVAVQVGCAAFGLLASMSGHAAPGDLEWLGVNSDGTPIRFFNGVHDVNHDGRYVLLSVDNDRKLMHGRYYLFQVAVRDRQAGTTRIVSVSSSGQLGNDWSYDGRITPDGRYVVFLSKASNLVANDTNVSDDDGYYDGSDVFVHDLQTGVTELVSIAPNGQQPNHRSMGGFISDDGRYVAFHGTGTNIAGGTGVFIRDRQTGTTARVFNIAGDQGSYVVDLSGNGRYVLFVSDSNGLVPDDTNNQGDLFVKDRQTGSIERVNILPDGSQTGSYTQLGEITSDGRYVSFTYQQRVYVRDLWAGTTVLASVASNGAIANRGSAGGAMSADGRYVQFESVATNLVTGDTNTLNDVFVRDMVQGTTELVSRNAQGVPSGGYFGAMSGDGRFAGFVTQAPLLPADTDREFDAYLYETGGGALAKIGYTIKPTSLDFGSQSVGTSRTLSFRLRNTGERELVLEYPSRIFLKSVDSSDQYSMTHGCGKTVAIGASCTINITFKPTSAGAKIARLRVIVEGVERTRKITGTGVAP